MHDETLVEVVADTLSDGRVVYEELWVQAIPTGGYRVMKTPLVAQGLAANDEIEVDPEDKSFRVLNRGGNVAIQLFMQPELANEVFDVLADQVRDLGGAFDAHTATVAGFSIPVTVGFERIERLFQAFAVNRENTEWMFGNVYDAAGSPLNWW